MERLPKEKETYQNEKNKFSHFMRQGGSRLQESLLIQT